jgi:peptidyl-lysine (3S)-dioxygenase / protease
MDLQDPIRALHEDSRQLWVPAAVPRIPYHPSAIVFLREYVAPNTPVIFTNCDCPAWSDDQLLAKIGDDEVVINRTPQGFGDHADQESDMFVKPWQTAQPFRSFLQELRAHGGGSDELLSGPNPDRSERRPGIPYYSAQSDCLRTHHPELLPDLPRLSFASAAFGVDPDAINLWVGDERSFTATHKDHYENLYLVVRGAKRFFLRPPCDAPLLPERRLPAATYAPCASSSSSVRDGAAGGTALRAVADVPAATVSWVVRDKTDAPSASSPSPASSSAAPPFPAADAGCPAGDPLVADVGVGEMLYLPALWYHAVAQRGVTVAVNWWFDMRFCGPSYVYYNFLRRLSEQQIAGAAKREVRLSSR